MSDEGHSQYPKWSPGYRASVGIIADIVYVIVFLALMFVHGLFGGSHWYFSYRQYNPAPRIGFRRAMIEDSELYRVARRYLDFHGETAAIEAAVRADTLMVSGDVDGADLWHRIVDAIVALQATVPGEVLH